MYSGESLFLSNFEGNMDCKYLHALVNWTEEYKNERLEKIKDLKARNLVSRLLMKDPVKRIDTNHALAHPFVTGYNCTRMIGDAATFDVFLSYRVSSDEHHCRLIYKMLTAKGLNVWWDKESLEPGKPWEEGFCKGLINCTTFIPVLSKSGLKNFECLTESSRCDNVLLEHRFALELKELSLVDAVFPIMIGECLTQNSDPKSCTYSHFLNSKCYPVCPDVVVKSVEQKLCEHLNHEGLGTPISPTLTVKGIYEAVIAHHGMCVVGPGENAFQAVIDAICKMIEKMR